MPDYQTGLVENTGHSEQMLQIQPPCANPLMAPQTDHSEKAHFHNILLASLLSEHPGEVQGGLSAPTPCSEEA